MKVSNPILTRFYHRMKNQFKLKDLDKVNKRWADVFERQDNLWKKELSNNTGKKILIATSTGGHQAVIPIESLLAVALTLRGARVHFLLCDKFLPACLQATITSFNSKEEFPKYGPQKSLCDNCFKTGYEMYKPLNLPIHLNSELVTKKEELNAYNLAKNINSIEIKGYLLDGLKVGEHAYAGALRYFARADLKGEMDAEKVLRRYFHAALLSVYATERILSEYNFDCVVFNHGIYIPQGITGEVARKNNVRVVNWNPAYRKQCFIFSEGDTYHHTLMNEPVSKWENLSLTKKLEDKTLNYLKSRRQGAQDWIWFHENPQFEFKHLQKQFSIDLSKPMIGMLTNVLWDAQLHYPDKAFPNMLTWIFETIKYFQKRKDLQLIIRIHPAEIRGTLPSRQLVLDEINKKFPELGSNIIVIPPNCNVSTYTIMEKCNTVIIYGTKTGVELTSVGIPVIVAGEAWVKNKGITLDPKTKDEYFNLLDKLPLKSCMATKNINRARKYAFHFFFRRMIPINSVVISKGWPPYKLAVKTLEELLPGKDDGLDIICDGILSNKDFIFPAEKLKL